MPTMLRSATSFLLTVRWCAASANDVMARLHEVESQQQCDGAVCEAPQATGGKAFSMLQHAASGLSSHERRQDSALEAGDNPLDTAMKAKFVVEERMRLYEEMDNMTTDELEAVMTKWAAADAQVIEKAAAARDSPIPATQHYRGATMLMFQVPVSKSLQKYVDGQFRLGEDVPESKGSIKFDKSGQVLVTIADFSSADVGFTGEPGSSDIADVPHRLMTVRIPVLKNGEKALQTAFALTNNDIPCQLYRTGDGLPTKMANISWPASVDQLATGGQIVADRRTLPLLKVTGAGGDVSEADEKDVQSLFALPDYNHGTDLNNYLHFVLNMTFVFKERTGSMKVSEAHRLKLKVDVTPSPYEPLSEILQSVDSVDAFWIKGDLTETTVVKPVQRNVKALFGDAEMDPVLELERIKGMKTADYDSNMTKTFLQKQFPMDYMNGDVIWMKMALDAEKVKKFLPPGFTLQGDAGYIWHVRWEPADIFGTFTSEDPQLANNELPLVYNELWTMVPVDYKGHQYMFPLLLLLDEDIAQTSGRETAGIPKKMANITYTFEPGPEPGATVRLHIDRHGRKVMDFTAKMGGSLKSAATVPGITEGAGMALLLNEVPPRMPGLQLPQYIFFQPITRTKNPHSMQDMSMSLSQTPQEPLGDWFTGEALEGGYMRLDEDWMPALEGLEFNGKDLPPQDEYLAWWKRTFQMKYM